MVKRIDVNKLETTKQDFEDLLNKAPTFRYFPPRGRTFRSGVYPNYVGADF
jgi:hypothetical protein